jgi:hypothetical protein
MTTRFCTQTARKIRKLGYAPKAAILYSKFLCASMLSVSGIMATCMRRRKGVKLLGEETPASLRHTPGRLIVQPKTTGAGIIIAGPAAVDTVPASSRIHRN